MINDIKLCDDCEKRSNQGPSRRIFSSLDGIGEEVEIEGSMNMSTIYQIYQCGKCGQPWLKVKDTGQGSGTFLHELYFAPFHSQSL